MENIFVEFLPPWVETGLQPAFYDKESGTVIQQTARMYARVNMLIRMFNKLSKNTKETVENYINQFNELHDYVHDYFDNLDVQEEINNKLDAMTEDGTLQEIITTYIQANVAWTFDSVADMKQATNFVDGSFAQTLGFYNATDGGGALYKIRSATESDTIDEVTLIEITPSNGELVAELVFENYANIKQLGGKGDGSEDASSAFNIAVSTGLPIIIPSGTYLLDSSITIDGNQNIHGEDSIINYTGNDYAFVINTTLKKIVRFGTINSPNGGCLEFYATTTASGDFSQYVDVYFKEFKCKTNGIYAEETGQGSWVNEIRIFNGRLSSYQEGGQYQGTGIKLVHNYNGADKINGWRFYNIGFEGLDIGVHCISTQGQLNKLIFVGCRHSEAFTTLFKTEGQVNTVLFITADGIDISKFTLSNDTSTFKLIGKAYNPNTGQYYGYGAEYNYGNWRYDNAGPLEANTDLNNLKQEGSYFCRDDAIKNTLTNLPQAVLDAQYLSFILIVKQITSSNTSTGRRCIQILITNTSMYFRVTYADNQWNDWKLNINSLTKASGNTSMTSYLPNASAYGCAIDTLGGIACWRFERLTFSSVPSNQPANTIPSALRPLRLYALPLFNTATNQTDASIVIKADGSIEFNNIATTGKYYGTLTYFLK